MWSLAGSNKQKFIKNDLCHLTKMAAMPKYGKNSSKIFFSQASRSIPLNLSVKHLALKPIIVCQNDDPEMTLTYFTAWSILLSEALIWEIA